jgi:ABC-2 type transport system ATP-binding protein
MIQVKNIVKNYDDFKALDNINIEVKKGSVYGLVGPNGAGKTTLIKILAGVYKPTSGEVCINNEPVYENNTVKNKIVFIPDDLYFFPMYTIKATAKFYSDIYSDFDWERYNKIKDILKIDENRRISKLSKGMKKQVAFWLTICTKPNVMILDEPVDGLDPVMRRQIWSILLQDVAEREMTVLISSHNLRELEDVCDYVGIMNKGTILIENELDKLKSDIHKVQVVFKDMVTDFKEDKFKILKRENVGSVTTLIVKGSKEDIICNLEKHSPIILDFIPLTLEEIFIYEVGGAGYEVSNIIL